MAEGRVYLCSWEQDVNGFHLWVSKHPNVESRGEVFGEAQEGLAAEICEHLGDGEAVLEFEPEPPVSQLAARFLSPALVSVVGNTRPDKFGPLEGLYAGESCKECRGRIGERTSVSLWISELESGYDGGFTGYPLAHILFFSDKFVSLLKQDEKAGLEFRPVQRHGRTRKKFCELIAKPSVPWVGVKGLQAKGWHCTECGNKAFGYWEEELPISQFLCKTDLPKSRPSCLVVGTPQEAHLCFTLERWKEMRGKPGTQGLVGAPVGIVDEEECERNPPLPTYKEAHGLKL
jgi:hypothetical protein